MSKKSNRLKTRIHHLLNALNSIVMQTDDSVGELQAKLADTELKMARQTVTINALQYKLADAEERAKLHEVFKVTVRKTGNPFGDVWQCLLSFQLMDICRALAFGGQADGLQNTSYKVRQVAAQLSRDVEAKIMETLRDHGALERF